MEEQVPPRASLLLGSDDTETLEAALTFIDECSASATDSGLSLLALDASAIVESSRGFVSDLEHFDIQMHSQPPLALHMESRTTKGGSSSSLASASRRSRRRTGAQELKQLRLTEFELTRKLENLQLNMRAGALRAEGADPRLKAAMSFWGSAAARQYLYRSHSEQENRRLRAVVAKYSRRAKQLQQAWRRQLDAKDFAEAINPLFQNMPTSSDIVPADTPAVSERLMAESHEVYAGIDAFLNARRQQRLNGNTFFEHSDTKTLPFERHIVEQAVWRALGYRVIRPQTNFYRDHVEATDDTVSSCAHLVIRHKDLGLYIQLRLAGRKYREENRTIIVMRALVEPKRLDNRAPIGLAFQETHVRVITPSVPAIGGPEIDATTVQTHVVVTRHLPGDWTREFWRDWSDDNFVRSMWEQAITARMLVIEDQLFDEAREARQ